MPTETSKTPIQSTRQATTQATTQAFDDHAWNYARYRYSILIAALFYPVWQPAYAWVLDGKINDSIWERFAVSAACLVFVGSTYFPKIVDRWIQTFFTGIVCLISAHVFYLVAMNDLNILYVLGAYCVMFASGAILLTQTSLFVYFAMCVCVTLKLWVFRMDANSLFLFMGAITSLAVTFASSQAIISLLKALRLSKAEISRSHKEIESVMNSLGQGFLSFLSSGECKPMHSQACLVLLEGSPAGKMIWDVLRVPADKQDQIKEWVRFCFELKKNAPTIGTTLSLGPQTFPHSMGHDIVLEYYPVFGEQDEVTEVVVVATDKTVEFQAKRQTELEQNRFKTIATIVEQRASFRPFLADTRAKLQSFAQKSPAEWESGALEVEYKRFLHTIKGGFGLFAMTELASFVHDLEEAWKKSSRLEDARNQCSSLLSQVDAFLNHHGKILGARVLESERMIEVPVTRALTLIEKSKVEAPAICRELVDVSMQPIGEYFQQYVDLTRTLARKQAKKVTGLKIENAQLPIFPEAYQTLFASFVHVFRNAIDHGLELPAERTANGKAAAGSISVRFEKIEREGRDCLLITVEDDGRGVNVEKLRAKLQTSGLTDDEVLQSVFDSGVTTRDVVTDLSGRGVGLDALKFAATAIGGTARIQSRAGRGSTVIVEVPYITPVTTPRVQLAA